MIRIDLQVDLTYEIDAGGADFVFNIHAANTLHQAVSDECLALSQPVPQRMHTDSVTGNRYLHVRAGPGELKLSYSATVGLAHYFADPAQIAEIPVRDIPPAVMGYIYPSRYFRAHAATIRALAVEDQVGALMLPHHCLEALSTDSGLGIA